MKRAWIVLLSFVAGIGAAVTYHYFEYAVRHSITYVWDTMFNTGEHRAVLVPLCLALTLVYFGVQHRLDPRSEGHESHGLGDTPEATAANFTKVLVIGFFSLVAGASLGPEAVLVPACVLLGNYIGLKLARDGKQGARLLGMAGFIGLFAAFFNSFAVGVLSLLLLKKQFKLRITPGLIMITIAASGGSALTLHLLESPAYVAVPQYSWVPNLRSLLLLPLLVAGGALTTYGIGAAHGLGRRATGFIADKPWWIHALVAGSGLSLLYLMGGSLVQFTGNESIVPMFKQATQLGIWGLFWITLVKVAAIGWSKATGYRGGMIFPTIFVASLIVAVFRLYVHDLNLIYGIIAVAAGALYADTRVKILL